MSNQNSELQKDRPKLLRSIPSVESVIKKKEISSKLSDFGREAVLNAVRRAEDEIRKEINSGTFTGDSASVAVVKRSASILEAFSKMTLKRAVNATGVIIHTNLGRAPLGREEISSIIDASGYSTLEIDATTGKRGSRQSHISELLSTITGAEDGMVVNNNAAAVFHILSAFARDREVIVSRGELIEIGGSFRIPEIMSLSGAKLVEVGTTNKTYISDFEKAIGENTALLMKVHPSNYRIDGFTHQASLEELVELGNKNNIPVVYDAGSGILVDLKDELGPVEISVQEAVSTGVDLVTFSGDKLLGGPQAGLIVGKKDLIDSLKRNHLARVVRIDKTNLAALEKTLRTYLAGNPLERIPVLRMIKEDGSAISKRAGSLARKLKKILREAGKVEVQDSTGKVGGGALPALEIPSKSVSVNINGISPDELDNLLRRWKTPIFSTKREDTLLLNALTLQEGDSEIMVECFKSLIST